MACAPVRVQGSACHSDPIVVQTDWLIHARTAATAGWRACSHTSSHDLQRARTRRVACRVLAAAWAWSGCLIAWHRCCTPMRQGARAKKEEDSPLDYPLRLSRWREDLVRQQNIAGSLGDTYRSNAPSLSMLLRYRIRGEMYIRVGAYFVYVFLRILPRCM